MKIAVITMWYNEELLAPYFLSHYGQVDKIVLLLDSDTNDRTREIASSYGKVEIRPYAFPDMMDDMLKMHAYNQAMQGLQKQYDWVICVDADEFVFAPRNWKSMHQFLSTCDLGEFNVVMAQMWQIYRHVSEKDLDPLMQPMGQRLHGDPNLWTAFNRLYIKPLAVSPSKDLTWGVGCHNIAGIVNLAPPTLYGAHWAMAEPDIAVARRIKGRRNRQSKRNLELGLTKQHHNITEDIIREKCREHANDPDVLTHVLP